MLRHDDRDPRRGVEARAQNVARLVEKGVLAVDQQAHELACGPTTLVTADSITDSRNLGSGTLATVDGTKGILTAAHVLEELAVALARTVLPPSSLGQAYTKADVEQTMIGDAPQPTMSAGWGKTSKSGAMLLSRDGAVALAPANPQRTCCPVRDGPLAIDP